MGKLTSVKPGLAIARPRLATAAPGLTRTQQRDQDAPWRRWYRTARWRRLRLVILDRDLWTCQQTGVLLNGKHPADDSPVADHIEPHHGNPDLFWDPENIQAVAKSWHDSDKQRMERGELWWLTR